MEKKRWVTGAALFFLFLSAACGSPAQPAQEGQTQLPAAAGEAKAVKTVESSEILNIYYGNAKADGLKVETKTVEAVVPETIIGCLANHNIVSIDTKVNSFDTDEEDGERILYLDLSKAFGEYLNTMGESGELVIMAALTNTFLEAYGADALVLTVDGGVLETGHAVYDEPLTLFKSEAFV